MKAITEQTAQSIIRCMQAEIVNVSDEQACIDALPNAPVGVFLTKAEAQELIEILSHAEDQRTAPYSYDACEAWASAIKKKIEEAK